MQVGQAESRFWLHSVLWTVPAASAIQLTATDHGEWMTAAGKRWSLLMARDDDELYDKKSQRYAEDNIIHSGKSEA